MTESTQDPRGEPRSRKGLVKGCGCGAGLALMALGILVVGGFDGTSWASAVIGVLIGVMVFMLSGVNGFWED